MTGTSKADHILSISSSPLSSQPRKVVPLLAAAMEVLPQELLPASRHIQAVLSKEDSSLVARRPVEAT